MSTFMHTTKDGREIALKDLDDSHLVHIIHWIERRATEGVVVRFGVAGYTADEMFYEEDELFGHDARLHLDYDRYVEEQKRRMRDEEERDN